MKSKFDPQTFLKQVDNGKTTLTFLKKQILFSQGDAADAVPARNGWRGSCC